MKRAEQIQHVEQWKASGLTQKAYCEKIGVKRTTFANWASRIKEKPEPGFIAITSTAPVQEGIELIYPNGVRLKTTLAYLPVLSELIHHW